MAIGKKRILLRLLKIIGWFFLVLIAVVVIAWFALRQQIASKLLDVVEAQLTERGLYIDRGSHDISWNQGLVLKNLTLYDGSLKEHPLVTMDEIGIRIPISDLFSGNSTFILSAQKSAINIHTSAGELKLENLDFKFWLSENSISISNFKAHSNGLNITADGRVDWPRPSKSAHTEPQSEPSKATKSPESNQPDEISLPDLAPIVRASEWLKFSGKHPTLALKLTPREGEEGGTDLEAELTGREFSWKTLPLEEAKIKVVFADGAVAFPSFDLDCFGGRMKGGLTIDYGNDQLRISEITSSADPFQFVAALPLKKSVANAMAKLGTLGRTNLKGKNITFNLKKFSSSKGTLYIDAPSGLLLKLKPKAIAMKNFAGSVKFSGGNLYVTGQRFTLSGGKASGTYSMPLAGSFRYKAKVKADSIPLNQLSSELGVGKSLTGAMMVDFDGGGASGVDSIYGTGSIKIEKGKFYSIPLLGALRSVLIKKSSLFGGDAAEDLTASFVLQNGTISSSNLRIEGRRTAVSVKGSYHLIKKTASIAAQAKLKGLVGVATGIVSKIFEVRGEGPVGNIKWKK